MTKVRCLLLDDELPGLTYLKMLCDQIDELEVVKAFDRPENLLAEAPCLDFDLCILDIEMPGMNGIQLANLLPGKQVIFVTAYKEYAAEAFDLDAVDYVRKPVQRERLQKAVQKVLIRTQNKAWEKEFFHWNTDKGKALLYFDRLLHIRASESDSRDKIVLMQDGSQLTLKNISFTHLHSILPVEAFVRVNKKEILALKVVVAYTSDSVSTTLNDESGRPMVFVLSEIYRPALIERVRV